MGVAVFQGSGVDWKPIVHVQCATQGIEKHEKLNLNLVHEINV